MNDMKCSKCSTPVLLCSQKCYACGVDVGALEAVEGQLVWRSLPAGSTWSFVVLRGASVTPILRADPDAAGRFVLVQVDGSRPVHVQELMRLARERSEVVHVA
jgi:hypothetical protein